MARLPYETQGGAFSEGATTQQLVEYLRLAQEAAAILGHYKKENGDWVDGQWFLSISEMVGNVCVAVNRVMGNKGRVQ